MISFQEMDASHLTQAVDALRADAIGLLQDLVRIPSVTGNEADVQRYVAGHLKAMQMDVDQWNPRRDDLEKHPAFSDDGLPLGERPVVVALWKGTEKNAHSLILNGHVDVVPVGDENAWQGGPWSGSYREGQVWGRGSCDMKGGLVSGIIAITALQRLGLQPRGDVLLESVIGEETGGVGTLATVLRGYRADAAIILEPTRIAICPVGAGAASFRLHVPGKAAHGAMRLEGVSAIEKFYHIYKALQELERSRHSGYRHHGYQTDQLVAPVCIGKVAAGDWPSTVAETLIAEGRYGVLPGESMQVARSAFERAVALAAQSDSWLREHKPKVEWFEGQFEPAETPEEAPILKALAEAHENVCMKTPQVHGVPYGSDLRFFTNHANMHAVLYGPGDVTLAHSLNEHVPVEEVLRVAAVIATMLIAW